MRTGLHSLLKRSGAVRCVVAPRTHFRFGIAYCIGASSSSLYFVGVWMSADAYDLGALHWYVTCE